MFEVDDGDGVTKRESIEALTLLQSPVRPAKDRRDTVARRARHRGPLETPPPIALSPVSRSCRAQGLVFCVYHCNSGRSPAEAATLRSSLSLPSKPFPQGDEVSSILRPISRDLLGWTLAPCRTHLFLAIRQILRPPRAGVSVEQLILTARAEDRVDCLPEVHKGH